MADQPPEQTIRDWLEANGPVRVGLEAFEQTWGLERLGARDRREIVAALASVGVRVNPSIDRISRSDKVMLSLEPPDMAEPGHVEPEHHEPEHHKPEPKDVNPRPSRTGRRRGRIWTEEPEQAPEPGPTYERREPVAHAPEADAGEHQDEAATTAPAGLVARVPRAGGILLAGAALMVLGSLGPWGKAVFVTDYGLDRHGALVIVAAVLATAVLALHISRGRPNWLPFLSAAIAALAAAVVASDYRDLVDDPFVGPYWGLYMAFAGCATVIGLSMALLVRPPRPPTGQGAAGRRA